MAFHLLLSSFADPFLSQVSGGQLSPVCINGCFSLLPAAVNTRGARGMFSFTEPLPSGAPLCWPLQAQLQLRLPLPTPQHLKTAQIWESSSDSWHPFLQQEPTPHSSFYPPPVRKRDEGRNGGDLTSAKERRNGYSQGGEQHLLLTAERQASEVLEKVRYGKQEVCLWRSSEKINSAELD